MSLNLYYLSFDEYFARGFPSVPCYADLGLFDIPETLKLAIENAPPSVKVLSLDYQCCTSDLKEFGRDRGMVIVPKFRSPETTQMFQMLRARTDRLEAAIREAEHGMWCDMNLIESREKPADRIKVCNCWKRDALEGT